MPNPTEQGHINEGMINRVLTSRNELLPISDHAVRGVEIMKHDPNYGMIRIALLTPQRGNVEARDWFYSNLAYMFTKDGSELKISRSRQFGYYALSLTLMDQAEETENLTAVVFDHRNLNLVVVGKLKMTNVFDSSGIERKRPHVETWTREEKGEKALFVAKSELNNLRFAIR